MFKTSGEILRDFSEAARLQNSEKSLKKFVLDAERRIERTLHQGLSSSFPGHRFLMEEAGYIPSDQEYAPLWIIDPLDGSSNFSKGIPFFSISVALYERQECIASVVYDPIRDEVFWAQKGVGAFLDQYRLRLAQKAPRQYVGITLPSPRHTEQQRHHIVSTLAQLPQASFRYLGATSLHLAYVAAGRLDGCVEYGSRIWDGAAGMMLVQEAGGKVTHNFDAQLETCESSDIIAAHPEFYTNLYRATEKIR